MPTSTRGLRVVSLLALCLAVTLPAAAQPGDAGAAAPAATVSVSASASASIAPAAPSASAPASASVEPAAPAPSASAAPPEAPSAHAPPEPPEAHPAPAGSAAPDAARPSKETEGAHVAIHERRVFDVFVGRGNRTRDARAASAAQVLERLVEEPEEQEIHADVEGDVVVVYGGKISIIQLGPEDAAAAGDASPKLLADGIVVKVAAAVRAERQRSAIATSVFGFSLLVFSGLIAFLLVRKVSELIERLRAWLEDNPQKIPALRVRDIEVVQRAAVRGGLGVALSAGSLVARIAIAYTWVLFALSLFASTRGYSERLTGFVLTPVSQLIGRVVSALPMLVITLCTVMAVGVTLRFVRLFFGSVARGETTVGWMPRDLAEPTSILVRAGVVISTLVVAAPLITGGDDGTFSRAGVVALVSLGLAATPVFACAAAGIAVVFGRRLRIGEHVSVGGRDGRVRALTMLEVLLEDEDGSYVHVPHLTSLWHPTRVVGRERRVAVELSVDPACDLLRVIELLEDASAVVGAAVRVEVIGLDREGSRLRVTIAPRAGVGRSELYCALAAALRAAEIPLGRASA